MAFPLSPTDGQLYTAPNGTVYRYNATEDAWFKDHGGVLVSEGSSFPSSPGAGDRHFDTNTETWYIWTESAEAWLDLSSAGLADYTGLKGKNIVQNGAMQIAQRGTSFTSITNASYSLDRWKYYRGGAAIHNITQDSDRPNDQFNYSMKIDCTTVDTSLAATDFSSIYQGIEGYDFRRLKGQTATISFWIKSNKTGTMCFIMSSSTADTSYVTEFTINQANIWEKKILTVSFDYTTGTWNYTNGIGLWFAFVFSAGSNWYTTPDQWVNANRFATSNIDNWCDSTSNYIKITGVQLEVGQTATDFDHLSFGEELALCQRYFQAIEMWGYCLNAYASSSSTPWARLTFPVPMRLAPTAVLPPAGQTTGQISFVRTDRNYPTTTGTNATTSATVNSIAIYASGGYSADWSVGDGCFLYSTGITYIQLSAEF